MPGNFKTMQADYAAYAKANGVLAPAWRTLALSARTRCVSRRSRDSRRWLMAGISKLWIDMPTRP